MPDGFRGDTFVRLLGYPVMIGGAVGLFLLVRSAGSTLVAPAPAFVVATDNATSANADALLHVLLALVVAIITTFATTPILHPITCNAIESEAELMRL